jgi:hypothetical protein
MKTKRAQVAVVRFKEVTEYISEYWCPACCTIYSGFLSRNVLRFICKCGQELIVKKEGL